MRARKWKLILDKRTNSYSNYSAKEDLSNVEARYCDFKNLITLEVITFEEWNRLDYTQKRGFKIVNARQDNVEYQTPEPFEATLQLCSYHSSGRSTVGEGTLVDVNTGTIYPYLESLLIDLFQYKDSFTDKLTIKGRWDWMNRSGHIGVTLVEAL